MTERGKASFGRALLALIGGQIALHSCMAGIRMAAPLAALREGHAAWAVGVLLGLFAAAPIALALRRRPARRQARLPPADPRRGRAHRRRRRLRGRRDAAAARPVHRPLRRRAPHRRRRELRPDRDPALGRADGARSDRAEADLLVARPRAGAVQRRRPGRRRHADRCRRLSPRLRRPGGAAARQPGLGAPRSGRAARRRRRRGAPSELLGPAQGAGLHPPPARQLAALVELGRALLPGADPRPRARLQRLGDRPRSSASSPPRSPACGWRSRCSPIACASRTCWSGRC